MALNTPKRIKTLSQYANSPPNNDCNGLTQWNWAEGSTSPASSCGSPEFIANQNNNSNNGGSVWNNSIENRENKRGRPRSEALTTLMVEGSISPSAIKCRYCNRVFPREKSLQAHLRTHTGERPYTCDYPGCTRAFTQSGQLKTHQRLHTGERPFICSATHCQMRFTHANRHCPDHPYDTLKRCDDFVIQTVPEQNGDVLKWLEKYRMEREDRTPTRKTPKRVKHDNHGNENENDNENDHENHHNENFSSSGEIEFPITPNNPYKSRKGLMCELDMNAGMGSASPITAKTKPNLPKLIQWQEPLSQEEDDSGDEIPARSTFNPKKKWLRDAWQDDLAKPLDLIPTVVPTSTISSPPPPPLPSSMLRQQLMQESNKSVISVNPNQMRPTVLMVASKDKTMPLLDNNFNHKPEETNRKWLGALALMQLATDDQANEGNFNCGEQILLNNDHHNITTSTQAQASVIHSYTHL